jgi:hypothetical protein
MKWYLKRSGTERRGESSDLSIYLSIYPLEETRRREEKRREEKINGRRNTPCARGKRQKAK